ncbi:hypothetical protein [Luteolibacter sp. Populi]|uniref:hypothetical protein n=1 Tax=Luteolibacter sp. Populi TaxID=3230487 RepID=UPI003466AB0C
MGRLVIIALLSGLIAWSISRQSPVSPEAGVQEGQAKEDGRKSSAPLLKTPAEFVEWARSSAEAGSGRFFEGWSNEDLKAALEEGIGKPAFGASQGALHALMMEWTKRDPDAAWRWLGQMRSESRRAMLSAGLAMGWPAERAREGLELAISHSEVFMTGRHATCQIFVRRALEASAADGPAGVEETLKRLREEKLAVTPELIKFPKGFDFKALFQSPAMLELLAERKGRFATGAWMKDDPEAAFQRLLEVDKGTDPQRGLSLGSGLLTTFSSSADSAEAAAQGEWMGKRIARLDPAEQKAIATSFVQGMRGTPVILREFLEAMPEGQARDDAALSAASSVRADGISAALDFLDTASGSSARVETLQDLLSKKQANWNLDLPAQEQEKFLRDKLQSWRASPEQTAEIIRLMQEVGR